MKKHLRWHVVEHYAGQSAVRGAFANKANAVKRMLFLAETGADVQIVEVDPVKE